MSEPANILTKEQFLKLVDAYHARERMRLSARWDLGAQRYGVLNLDEGRNYLNEAQEERDDDLVYRLFNAERHRRAMALAAGKAN
jgi:hypothetical protein